MDFSNIEWLGTLTITYFIIIPFLWIFIARWFYSSGSSESDAWGIGFCCVMIWPLFLLSLIIALLITLITHYAQKPCDFLLKYKNSQSQSPKD